MWVSKLESDDLNPVFKHILTWTNFVKFGWVKQRGKSPGGQIGQPQYHSTPLQDQWMLATCSSLLFSLILPSSHFRGVETNRTCVCLTCMTGSSGSVGACGYTAWRRCLWSVCCLVAAPPGSKHMLCFITFAIWYNSMCSAAVTRAHSCRRQVYGSHSAHKCVGVCVSLCVVINVFAWSQCMWA